VMERHILTKANSNRANMSKILHDKQNYAMCQSSIVHKVCVYYLLYKGMVRYIRGQKTFHMDAKMVRCILIF